MRRSKKIVDTFPIMLASGETFSSLKDLLNFTPGYSSFDGHAGSRISGTYVNLNTTAGHFRVIGDNLEEFASNHQPSIETTGKTVGQAIARCSSETLSISITSSEICSWEDDDWQYEHEVIVPLIPVDWTKVRRRLEDRIRKDPESMKKAASVLNIPLY